MDRKLSLSMLGNTSAHSSRGRANLFPFTPPSSQKPRSSRVVHIIVKSDRHTLQLFGEAPPVQITEALTFAERSSNASAGISPESGYAWVVCGRRLLIWQYQQPDNAQSGTPRRGTHPNQFCELQLPQSDLAHRAELANVFISANNTFPSCVAVSPEGLVRYWPAIRNEEMSIDQQIDLKGQECDSLTNVDGFRSILATTTCTLVLIDRIETPTPSLACRILRMPSGWLGGFSKKITSLIFGPDASEETRLVRVQSVPLNANEWNIFVLAGHALQKWRLSLTEAEEFVYGVDLTRSVKECFFSAFWENCGRDQHDVDSWIMDIQPDAHGLILLSAAAIFPISNQIHYALIHIDTSQSSSQFASFNILKFSGIYAEDKPSESIGFRFLHAAGTSYIYNHRCVTVVKPHEEHDCLDLADAEDKLLGASMCGNAPVFFSQNFGLAALVSNDVELSASNSSEGFIVEAPYCDLPNDDLLIYTFNTDEMQSKDALSLLRTACVHHAKGQSTARDKALSQCANWKWDKYVMQLSLELLDDVPVNDPRWKDMPVGLASSVRLQVANQLENKQRTHALFIHFLRESGLWNQLEFSTVRGSPMLTAYLVTENSEKIMAAIALKTKACDEILQKAMEAAVLHTDTPLRNELTCQDIVYCRLNKFHNVFIELINICDQAAHSDQDPQDTVCLIGATNAILLCVIKEVLSYRQNNAEFFAPPKPAEYLPWTAASGSEGLMDSLVLMQDLTYRYGAKEASDAGAQNDLYEQYVSIVDIILDGRKTHLESIRADPNNEIRMKQYSSDRRRFIEPLVKEGRWESAARLGEKYLDYESLVIICEKTNNQERLDMYMDRFQQPNFTEFVCNWYMQQNKQGKLLELCGRKANVSEYVRNFLKSYPKLSWIQSIQDRNYQQASTVLSSLALNEVASVKRLKTKLSLAKLSAIASKASESVINDINTRLELIEYQEAVPDYVLQQFKYNPMRPSVISAEDLINLYTCVQHVDATAVEFKKALELLRFINDAELRQQLSMNIWVAAIRRDLWNDAKLDSPMEILRKKLMFQLVELVGVLGSNYSTILPPMNDILQHPELQELHNTHSFEFLIKTAYEHFAQQ